VNSVSTAAGVVDGDAAGSDERPTRQIPCATERFVRRTSVPVDTTERERVAARGDDGRRLVTEIGHGDPGP